ncbi:MAG: SurA N-terminal domain-containing protein [Acidobacteriota bacterium]|nr:SurA N-terminal domain-containing protein [Acidobacteriota bacterium]
MTARRSFGTVTAPRRVWQGWLAMCLAAAMAPALAQNAQTASPVVLDRVVAVVNNQAILASDVDDEIRLSVLEPRTAARISESPRAALQRLISRTLIQQQIRAEEAQATAPTDEDVAARLTTLRKELPACASENCTTDAGWKAFLAGHRLTQERVEAYIRNRLEILRFIEMRFRQGISISRSEVETYYRDTLLPQYPAGEKAPPLDQVEPRIEEILLQQQVNVLFSDWLDNLRKQGDIEVLDPALEPAANPAQQGAATE